MKYINPDGLQNGTIINQFYKGGVTGAGHKSEVMTVRLTFLIMTYFFTSTFVWPKSTTNVASQILASSRVSSGPSMRWTGSSSR